MRPFTSQGIHPASHPARSRTLPRFRPPPPAAGHGVAKSSFITPRSLRADLQRNMDGGHGSSPCPLPRNSPSHTAGKNNSSCLIHIRRNVHLWVFQCLKNKEKEEGGAQLRCFAVLEAGPSAPGLWHCHRPAPLLNAQHKGQGPERATCFSSSLPVPHASLQSPTPSPPSSRHQRCHTGRKHTLWLTRTQINHSPPADRLLSAQASAHHS